MLSSSTRGHYFERNDSDSPSPRIISAMYLSRDKRWRSANPNSHPHWVLDYSISNCGRTRALSKDEPWLERPPRIAHLYPPYTKYWEDTSRSKLPVESSYIIFSGGERAGLGRLCTDRKAFARICDDSGIIGELLEEMNRAAASRGDASFWMVQSMFFRLLDMLVNTLRREEGKPYGWKTSEGDDDSAFLRRVQELLSQNLARRPSLAELAKQLKMSRSALSHRYRNLAGESPMETLAGLRISTAKGLLLKSEPLKSIAAKTGFYDEFHFSKSFKALTGLPPSKYRKRK